MSLYKLKLKKCTSPQHTETPAWSQATICISGKKDLRDHKTAGTILNKGATKAVNVYLTIRNLLIGYYIVEFEQDGKDRAEYGKHFLQNLAGEINMRGLTAPELSRCWQFYKVYYPVLWSVFPKFKNAKNTILSLPPHQLENLPFQILGTASQEL